MRYEEHIAAIETELHTITGVLANTDLSSRVPSCPDWSLRDLAKHAGDFLGFWTHIVCEGTKRPKTPFEGEPGSDVAAWFEDLGRHLVTELRAAPEDTQIWTWAGDDPTVRFAARRATHELTIHRYDAQLAAGSPKPIDAAVAADGIEEILIMAPTRRENFAGAQGESLHLHGTDQDAEWTLVMTPDGLEVTREHAKGDTALRGAVGDLELTLYQRPPIGEVERFGDEKGLQTFYRCFTFD